ncbi:DMT family transporter [Mycoplasmatota bacterium WC44]
MSNYAKGVILILLSSLFFTINATAVKLLTNFPLYEKIFVRNFLGMLFILPIILKDKSSLKVNKSSFYKLILRCVIGFLGLATYYYAIDNMVLADATILNKLNAFFVMIFSFIFLSEKLKKYQVIAILFAFVGAAFVIKPTFDSSVVPSMFALISAAFAGGAYTVIRGLSGKVKPVVIVFYFSTFTSLASIILLIGTEIVIPNFKESLLLILMGVSATIAQVLMTSAYKYAEASRISIYNYSSIVFAIISTFILFSDVPDMYSLIGALIIISSGVYNYRINIKRI